MPSLDLNKCVGVELDCIVNRRAVVGLDDNETGNERERKARLREKIAEGSEGLVGLALSGGGVRSAAFNLGLLQALRKRKRFQEVDYLSTVSGGGYVGAYVTSLAGEAVGEPAAPDGLLDIKPDGRQPDGIDGLIDRCRFLNRIVPWLNRQLIGLLVINVVVVSGLIALASLLAFVYRTIDKPEWRDWPASLGFRSDISQAFFYSYLLFALWLLAWLIAYLTRGSRATGSVARFLAVLLIVSLCLGAATVAGNGDVSLGDRDSPAVTRSAENTITQIVTDYGSKALIAALFAALIPYLNPRALIRSAQQPKSAAQRWTYAIASRALLFGVPLFAFYYFAQENISGQQEKLSRRESYQVVKKQLDEFEEKWKAEHPGNSTNPRKLWGARRPQANEVRAPSSLRARSWPEQHLVAADFPNWGAFWNAVERDALHTPITADGTAKSWSVPGPLANALLTAARSSKKLALNAEQEQVPVYQAAKSNDKEVLSFYDRNLPHERWLKAGASIFASEPDNDFSRQIEERRNLQEQKHDVLEEVNKSVIDNTALFKDWENWGLPVKEDGESQRIADIRKNLARVGHLQQPIAAEGEPADDSEEKLGIQWQIAQLNRALLAQFYPDFMAPYKTIYSFRVLEADQKHRLSVAWRAGIVFLLAMVLVNLNATSLHQWYRDALRRAWLWRPSRTRNLELATLDTASHGLPYHLIGTTVNMTWAQLGETIQTDNFVLSPAHCGSLMTGYEPTARFSGGDCDLASAMALSGAAIDPVVTPDPLLSLLLTLSNSRLSQWFVNPGRKDWLPVSLRNSNLGRNLSRLAGKTWISPAAIAIDWILMRPLQSPKERRYCRLSDGGHTENLGVEQLLLRRCHLIIASDASEDSQYQFASFDQMLTRVSARYGIQFREIGTLDVPPRLDGLLPNRPGKVSMQHLVLMEIHYPPATIEHPVQKNRPGYLIYLKPSFTDDEGVLLRYRDMDGNYPFDPTYDQLFDPDKFRAYIELGNHIGNCVATELQTICGNEPLSRFRPAGVEKRATPSDGNDHAGGKRAGEPTHWLEKEIYDIVQDSSQATPEAQSMRILALVRNNLKKADSSLEPLVDRLVKETTPRTHAERARFLYSEILKTLRMDGNSSQS